MSDPIVFWHHLKLGDMKVDVEEGGIPFTGPQQNEAYGAERDGFHWDGANAKHQVVVKFAFQRGYDGAEGYKAFARRVRTFKNDWITTMALGAGNLVFVRDPDGDEYAQDETTVDIAATAGDDVDVTLTGRPPDWAADDYVLFRHNSTPTTAYEVSLIEALSGANKITVDIDNSYGVNSEVFRAEYHLPNAAPVTELRGPNGFEELAEFELSFVSTSDYVNGVSDDG